MLAPASRASVPVPPHRLQQLFRGRQDTGAWLVTASASSQVPSGVGFSAGGGEGRDHEGASHPVWPRNQGASSWKAHLLQSIHPNMLTSRRDPAQSSGYGQAPLPLHSRFITCSCSHLRPRAGCHLPWSPGHFLCGVASVSKLSSSLTAQVVITGPFRLWLLSGAPLKSIAYPLS